MTGKVAVKRGLCFVEEKVKNFRAELKNSTY
jgi:hypothetical protein